MIIFELAIITFKLYFKGKVKIIVTAAVAIFLMQIILLGIDLPPVILVLNVVVFCFAVIYATWKWNSGKVKFDDSAEFE